MGKFGEIRGEVACWRTKRAISLKCVKIEEKLKWRAYRKSPTLFRTVPSPTPYGLPFTKIRGSQPIPKLQSLLSQERLKLRIANLADTFTGPSEHKPMKNFGE